LFKILKEKIITQEHKVIFKKQLFPALISAAAFIFLFIIGTVKKDIIFYSLSHVSLSVLVFIFFIIVFNFFNKLTFKPKQKVLNGREEESLQSDYLQDGLKEINKEKTEESETGNNYFLNIKEIVFIIIFLGVCAWFIFRMLEYSKAFLVNINHSIVDAVLLLLFPIIIFIYLKMKKDDNSLSYGKIIDELLIIFSYTSIVYALIITISSALKLNIIFILKWIYCAVIIFIPLFLGIKIVLYVIRKEKLNFSLKSLYTIKYALKILPAVVLGFCLVLFISTSIFVVEPHQQALVYRFGRLEAHEVIEEGIHIKLPFPIDRARIYDVYRVNSMQIGYQSTYSENYLWTKSHDGGENTMLLGDGNEMVAVNIKVIFKISNLYSYVRTYANPEEVLRAAAYEALMYRTVNTSLDEFLSVDRSSLSASLEQELSRFCKEKQLGVSVIQVIIESIHPPIDIADFYQRVVTALVIKNTIITRAQSQAAQKIIAAQQENRTVVDNAIANKHSRVSEAQKEMAVYYAAMQAYAISPASFELVKYLDTYEKIIGNNKVYVFSPRMENAISRAVIGNKTGTNVIGAGNE